MSDPEARFCPNCGAALSRSSAGSDELATALSAALGSQYRIERLLGRGGMGAVYLAHDLALDRKVAVKALPPEVADTGQGKDRFRREARTAAQLQHPGIVPLLTFGETAGLMYFVMGYVDGEPLSARIARRGRLETEDGLKVLRDLVTALGYAHGLSVVHRDIKPENVLIERNSLAVKLTDFGIARSAREGSLTMDGMVVGTPSYMSPEQASGRADIDARSDVYAVGVLAHAIFAGRPPFEGRPSDLMAQHLSAKPPSLSERVPGIPKFIDEAVARCLKKSPDERFLNAAQLLEALEPKSLGLGALTRFFGKGGAPSVPARESERSGGDSTPLPSSLAEFRSAFPSLVDDSKFGKASKDRITAAATRLMDLLDSAEGRLVALQRLADPIELKRAEKKRLGILMAPGGDPLEGRFVEALETMERLLAEAAERASALQDERARNESALRRFYVALRRIARSGDEQALVQALLLVEVPGDAHSPTFTGVRSTAIADAETRVRTTDETKS